MLRVRRKTSRLLRFVDGNGFAGNESAVEDVPALASVGHGSNRELINIEDPGLRKDRRLLMENHGEDLPFIRLGASLSSKPLVPRVGGAKVAPSYGAAKHLRDLEVRHGAPGKKMAAGLGQ